MSVAFLAQGVSLALSFLTALIVPKLLGVTEFGYWQLFLFYIAYVGFFHFGLNDGVYLINGGNSRATIDKASIVSQFQFGLVIQIAVALCIMGLATGIGFEKEREFVLIATAIYLVIHNAAGYIGYLFQALNETKLYSVSCIVNRIAFLVPLVTLLLLRCGEFEYYVVFYTVSELCSLAFCCVKGRDILFGQKTSLSKGAKDAIASIRVGVKLMIANVASSLILGFMRFAVDANWGIDAFGELSFSLSLVHFFLVFISQASMVLFPALRNITNDEVRRVFDKARRALGIALPAVYALYFPAKWLLVLWLPQYEASLVMFALFLPLCVFDGKMNLVGTTFLKVVRKEKLLLIINLVAMAASFVLVTVNVLFMASVPAMAISIVVVIAARSIATEQLLASSFRLGRDMRLVLAEIALTALFLVCALILRDLDGLALYASGYALVCFVNRSMIGRLLRAGKK